MGTSVLPAPPATGGEQSTVESTAAIVPFDGTHGATVSTGFEESREAAPAVSSDGTTAIITTGRGPARREV